MSALLRSSSRLVSTISRRNRRLSSTLFSEVPRDSIISSSRLGDRYRRFLKFELFAAFTGAVATTGYATYAYSSDEIDEKIKALRASANITIRDDADSLDKLKAYVSGAAMSGSAKLVEVYLDLRRLAEERVREYEVAVEFRRRG